ncbi:MAG: DUF4197 domain-containing protein [Deltaproteobacteria bacterium]|nr:DUF4197 domain-containing protein [Deltaproteobacteria bacterium]
MKRKIIVAVFFSLLFCQVSQASLLDVLKDTLDGAGTSEKTGSGKIDLGLKEALHVGIKNAVTALGKNNGYFTNQAVKILLPDEVRQAESVLRGVGFGPELDEFTLSMNRAAEKAAPLAADIFAQAITDMSFDDANKILKGGNTAATDYLKEKTYARLLALFEPAVRKTMRQYKVTEQYDAIAGKVQGLPLLGKVIHIDVNHYVSSKALDGLYFTLAKEETNIRTNPKARVTSLLKEVFK